MLDGFAQTWVCWRVVGGPHAPSSPHGVQVQREGSQQVSVWASLLAQWQRVRLHAGDAGSVSESGRSPGGGHGNPLQYSCLEDPTDRGAWWATVHGVTQSRTWLSDWIAPDCLFPVSFCWHVWLQASALSSVLSPFLLKIGNSLFSFLYVNSNPLKYLIVKYISTSIAYHRS